MLPPQAIRVPSCASVWRGNGNMSQRPRTHAHRNVCKNTHDSEAQWTVNSYSTLTTITNAIHWYESRTQVEIISPWRMGAEFGMYSFAGYSELRMCLGSGQSAQRPRLTVLLFNMPNEHVKFYCYCYERMNEWTNVKCVFYGCRHVVSLYEFRTNSTHSQYQSRIEHIHTHEGVVQTKALLRPCVCVCCTFSARV